jgi:hypothetical protein
MLGVWSVSNLFHNRTRADGPWELSAVLGDKLLAAVAFGCPALKTLEVSMICNMYYCRIITFHACFSRLLLHLYFKLCKLKKLET